MVASGFETIRCCFHRFCSWFSCEKTDEKKVGYNSHFFNSGNPLALLAMQRRRGSTLLLCGDEVGEVFLFSVCPYCHHRCSSDVQSRYPMIL